ncbi:unnamed protein product [Danaus chrysippus]|uniref:Ubiquitin-protein ligase E3C n=1 Tax=Danaus chrysippus TaxID=151541 RepID=A0A8J2R4S1_9NEOP|nr:unnamed protein product [Danaus chrysippus]
MYSFEGDFRRKPQQNLAGASGQRKTDRNTLILQTQQQRQKREVALSQLLLKQWKRLFQLGDCSVQIRRLLALHLHFLRDDSEVPLAVPLRMFEVFTSVNSLKEFKNHDESLSIIGKSFLYLVKRGYFKDLCILLCQKTPPLYGPSPNPPTPLCGALFDLIQRPLQLTTHIKDSEYDDTIMTEFTAAYLCNHYPEPVEMYILPALIHDKKFPFLSLLQCLTDEKFSTGRIVNDSWLLHSILILEPIEFVKHLREIDNPRLSNNKIVLAYMKILAKLTVNVCNKQITYEYEDSLYSHETAADNDDSSDSENEPNPTSVREQMLLTKCIEILNETDKCVMMTCSQIKENDLSDEFLDYMSKICHNLLLSHRMALHKYRLLYTLAFKPIFLRGLWQWLSSMSHESSFGGSSTPLLSALSRGMGAETSVIGVHRLLAPLAVFCELFSLLIGTLHDTEFFTDTDGDEKMSITSTSSGTSRVHAFDFSELGGLCRTLKQVCLGLVELAYPESRPAVVGHYKDAVGGHHDVEDRNQTPAWAHLFKVCTQLLRSLYARDARLQFVGGTSVGSVGGVGGVGGAWVAAGSAPSETEAALAAVRAPRTARPYRAYVPRLARAEQDEGPPLTIKELRTVTILREIPFVVPFSTRVLIFQGLLLREKHDHWYEMTNFNEGPSIIISVRRTHLYEDAFDKLSQEPNLKLKLRVQLINQAGAEEPGVDGGGLFREFLSELLKSAFDPNRGLFRLTKDNMLYPNPGVHLLYDDFPMHYYFVGRMLGKALYENLLVELPLAEFFLAKLCSTREPDVHALASLDPGLYRGLLMLKAHREDVSDLGLDFTILSDELGEQRIDELKPGGANIPVTAENRIEYIHLVADYKLNRQIRSQCIAFKRGLTSVVNAEWLRMFSCRELQLLISGAEVPIDLVDLRRHTQYGGKYTKIYINDVSGFSDSHPTVQCFWKVLEGFTDHQRRQLLKFVTSCSRPPLLGFKDLQPPFCIQSAGGSDRLPSSSTCMNLLKIPEYHSQDVLADKLLYAIQAGAGFELS